MKVNGLENYSPAAQKALKAAKAAVCDRIRVRKGDSSFEGLLLPRSELGDRDSIILKLDNGYNIGIRVEKGTTVEKIGHAKLNQEEKFEFGREKVEPQHFDSNKPAIGFVATGGTIVSKVEYATGGVVALESPVELLSNIPELKSFCSIPEITIPYTKMSEDLLGSDWQKLAAAVAKEVNRTNGVIVTHGTDMLHYTAAALSFMLKDLKRPVIITGSQRSSDRGSSDAFMNILCSARAALADFAGVYVCMHATPNDDYCLLIRGTKARKMHTSRRDAFRPVNERAIAKIWPDGRVEMLNNNHQKRSEGKCSADTKFESKVGILKTYPGADPALLDWMVAKGYRGIVIEAGALGHVPTESENSWIPSIKKAVKKGIPVVVASQCIYGRVNANVYKHLRILFHEAGAIPAEDMTAETAYVKLCCVLGHSKRAEDVRTMMVQNMAGEINERLTEEEFLL
ncbi:MAG: Glu-tRNA(Gln) amidotransferase subunit GatD [Candidatus Aenigmatarchaeota archaeon]